MTRAGAAVLATVGLSAAVTTGSPTANDSRNATVDSTMLGRVVDAACYLMHPDAASGKAHDECGTACAKRGVPLGVVNEADGTLYLDLEGRTRLLPYLHERVRVKGVTERQKGPLRLELPVSQTNTMEVQLEGGYYVVRIREVGKAPAPPAHDSPIRDGTR